jgi:hypothetical protein
MRGMLPHSEARMRMCIMKMGQRGRWTYRDWTRWRFLWKYFPWYAREMRYRGDFCVGQGCMHWFWEDPETKERGYCSAAVSRTQHMMWATEWEDHARHDPDNRSFRGSEHLGRSEQAARPRGPIANSPRRQNNAFKVVVAIAFWSAIVSAVVLSLL